MITYADVTATMEAAVAALNTRDYGLAVEKALAAQALMSVLPDVSRGSGGGGSQSTTWDRVAITTFLDRVQRLHNGASGMKTSKAVLKGLN